MVIIIIYILFVSLDNSNYMRNGDFVPTRMEAQYDAVNLVATTKIEGNPENTVAIIASAFKTYFYMISLINFC